MCISKMIFFTKPGVRSPFASYTPKYQNNSQAILDREETVPLIKVVVLIQTHGSGTVYQI